MENTIQTTWPDLSAVSATTTSLVGGALRRDVRRSNHVLAQLMLLPEGL